MLGKSIHYPVKLLNTDFTVNNFKSIGLKYILYYIY